MDKLTLTLKCPRCGLPAKAKIDESYHKFIIYTCPKCKSNVAYYDNKIDIISDRLLTDLLKKKKLRYCGDVMFLPREEKLEPTVIDETHAITKDDITDLKILLNTENDFDKIISKL